MEGKDIKGLMEAYSKVNETPEVFDEEIVVVQDILGEDVEILDEAPNPNTDVGYRVGRGLTNAIKDIPAGLAGQLTGQDNDALRRQRQRSQNLNTLLRTGQVDTNSKPKPTVDSKTQQQIDKNTKDRQTMNPDDYFGTGTKPAPKPSGGLTPEQKAQVLAKQRAETDAAMKGDPRAPRPAAPRPAAPVPKPNPTVLAKKGGVEGKLDKATGKFTAGNFSDAEKTRYNKVAGQKKDAATNAKYQELRKTDPAKAKEFGMKANQAKFGKDFAKPKTPNPLMKDMPGQNKAELETIRGNAAIDSISKSPNAKKILSGTAKSASANKIGQASVNRSEFGSATKPVPAKPSTSVSNTFKPVAGAPTKSAANTKFNVSKPIKPLEEESMNIFDIIKSHLLDEGYAETEENALVIMTNMSEEWRDEIVERYKGKHGQSSDEYKRDRSPGGKMVSGDDKQSGAEYTHGRRVKAENPGSQPDEGGKTKPKSQGKMDKGTRADLEYRKANLKKEEAEYVDENRRAARSAGGYKDDSEGQPDPSKDGFTGIGKMSIKDIMALNKKIEARKAKKEETQVEGDQIDEVLGGQSGDGYIGHPRLGIKNPMAKKQTNTNTSSNTGIAGKLGNRASQMDAAMKAARGQ